MFSEKKKDEGPLVKLNRDRYTNPTHKLSEPLTSPSVKQYKSDDRGGSWANKSSHQERSLQQGWQMLSALGFRCVFIFFYENLKAEIEKIQCAIIIIIVFGIIEIKRQHLRAVAAVFGEMAWPFLLIKSQL